MSAKFDINLKMYVVLNDSTQEKELTAEWDLLNCKANFTADVNDFQIRGHLHEAKFDIVNQKYCSFGKIDNILLTNIVNTYFSDERYGLIPLIDKSLAWLTTV